MTEEKKCEHIVLAAVDDMFFAAKIRGAGEAVGVNVRTARTTEKFFEKLKELNPAIIIVDLHSENCDPFAIAQKLKDDGSLNDVPLIGFFSHVHTELMERAIAVGYDKVMPRSAFSSKLPEILKGNF